MGMPVTKASRLNVTGFAIYLHDKVWDKTISDYTSG